MHSGAFLLAEAIATNDPAPPLETQAQPPADSQDVTNVTDGGAAVQASEPEDEGTRLHREAIEAARLEGIELGKQELARNAAAAERETRQKRNLDDLNGHFREAANTIRRNLGNLVFQDRDGNLRGMTDAEIQGLVMSQVEGLHGRHIGVKAEDLNTPFEDGAAEVLGEEYEAFAKKADGLEPKDFVRELGEAYAPKSKFVRSMTLEEAEAASPKVKSELAKLRDDLFRKGRAQGQKDPPGEHVDGAERAAPTSPDYKSAINNPAAVKNMSADKVLEMLEKAAAGSR